MKMHLKKFAVLKVFAIVWVVSYAETGCPDAEDIKPCTCYGGDLVVLGCQNITNQEALRNVFKHSARYNYFQFYLTNSSIPFLSRDMFNETQIEQLYLESVNLVQLFDNPPDTLSNLEYLDIRNTTVLSQIRWELFEPLTKLKTIIMFASSIKTLDSEFSTYVTKGLEELIFYGTETKTIKSGVFKDFVNLIQLVIQFSELTTLSRDMFPTPFNVYSLYFNQNKIAAIPEDLFTNMPNLRFLNLADNQLGVLPESAFRDVFASLNELTLLGNPLKCDCLLYWLVKDPARRPLVINGNCASPKNLNGRELKDLTKGDFNC